MARTRASACAIDAGIAARALAVQPSAVLAAALALAVQPAGAAEPTPHARVLAATCTACHGPLGGAPADTDDAAFAPLAGRPAAALLAQLRAYRDGTLAGTLMPQLTKGYSDAELADIAAWFAAQPAAVR